MGRAGLLVGGSGGVEAIIAVALVQLGLSVALSGSQSNGCCCFGLYPHHDGFSLKHSNLFSEVLVGLKTWTQIISVIVLSDLLTKKANRSTF